MPEIKLTVEEMRYISLFQDITGAKVKDCVIDKDDDRIIFIVEKGDAGKAIGRGGKKIREIQKVLNKNIEVVEHGDTVEELARNAVMPARVRQVKIDEKSGKKTVYIVVDPQDKGAAIGKNGKTVRRAQILLNRYFNIDRVIIV